METRHNFKVLGLIEPPLTPKQKLKYCINFQYGSLRKFSSIVDISHTALCSWMDRPEKYPEAHRKIIQKLGFDPFLTSGSMIGG